MHCRLTVTMVVSVWILHCDVTFNLVNFKQMKVLETSEKHQGSLIEAQFLVII